ncbi:MAG TPA: polysaccharide biosynthesis/export family protein [Anaeromyxobacteraceae bacterium]|nr:polysaccharide biosynthesis/export family protein [Anaeromyxobacteraceae bacterium]
MNRGLGVCAALACALAAASASGCKTTGEYVWVDDLPAKAPAPPNAYVIQVGDTIAVRVWNQDAISTKVKVRPDGKVSVPFVNDVEAAGSTPTDLASRIQARLQEYIVSPVVTVVLEDARPMTVAVLGEVARPGNYQLDAGAGVLPALAVAGGMTPFASRDRIMVIRQKPDGSGAQRIRFTYSALTSLEGRAATFRLQGGDVVVVE